LSTKIPSEGLTAMLIVVALLIVINPEVRILLLLVDTLGIDILLILLFLQLPVYAWVLYQSVVRHAQVLAARNS
jgi:hypothetical protein